MYKEILEKGIKPRYLEKNRLAKMRNGRRNRTLIRLRYMEIWKRIINIGRRKENMYFVKKEGTILDILVEM